MFLIDLTLIFTSTKQIIGILQTWCINYQLTKLPQSMLQSHLVIFYIIWEQTLRGSRLSHYEDVRTASVSGSSQYSDLWYLHCIRNGSLALALFRSWTHKWFALKLFSPLCSSWPGKSRKLETAESRHSTHTQSTQRKGNVKREKLRLWEWGCAGRMKLFICLSVRESLLFGSLSKNRELIEGV